MTTTRKLALTRTGSWSPSSSEGPSWRDLARGVTILGSYSTTGDNLRGWRKAKVFVLFLDGTQVETAYSLERARRIALRQLDRRKHK